MNTGRGGRVSGVGGHRMPPTNLKKVVASLGSPVLMVLRRWSPPLSDILHSVPPTSPFACVCTRVFLFLCGCDTFRRNSFLKHDVGRVDIRPMVAGTLQRLAGDKRFICQTAAQVCVLCVCMCVVAFVYGCGCVCSINRVNRLTKRRQPCVAGKNRSNAFLSVGTP